MARVNKVVIIGNLLSFARVGADDGGTPVSSTHKPVLDAAVYESLGGVEELTIESKDEEIIIKEPSPGRYAVSETIPVSTEMMLTGVMQKMNQLTWEMLLRLPGAIVIGTPQEPMKQSARIKGWLQHKLADQTDTETAEGFYFVELNVKPIKTKEKEYKYEMTARVLANSLNSFELIAWA